MGFLIWTERLVLSQNCEMTQIIFFTAILLFARSHKAATANTPAWLGSLETISQKLAETANLQSPFSKKLEKNGAICLPDEFASYYKTYSDFTVQAQNQAQQLSKDLKLALEQFNKIDPKEFEKVNGGKGAFDTTVSFLDEKIQMAASLRQKAQKLAHFVTLNRNKNYCELLNVIKKQDAKNMAAQRRPSKTCANEIVPAQKVSIEGCEKSPDSYTMKSADAALTIDNKAMNNGLATAYQGSTEAATLLEAKMKTLAGFKQSILDNKY